MNKADVKYDVGQLRSNAMFADRHAEMTQIAPEELLALLDDLTRYKAITLRVAKCPYCQTLDCDGHLNKQDFPICIDARAALIKENC